jgi:hypothetical protein
MKVKQPFAAWIWSLGVVLRSYRAILALAVVLALWGVGAYEWLGLPESSGLMLVLALIWGIAQLLVVLIIVGGTVGGAANISSHGGGKIPISALWAVDRRSLGSTLIFCLASLLFAGLIRSGFGWVGKHSVEVASFLTFHLQKAVSHAAIEKIYEVVEGLLWIIVNGFLISLFVVFMRCGWREAGKQKWRLLGECILGGRFLASVVSLVLFGGIALELANRRPTVPPGLWDYAQTIVRLSLALIIVSVGVLFWVLSLSRLQAHLLPPSANRVNKE